MGTGEEVANLGIAGSFLVFLLYWQGHGFKKVAYLLYISFYYYYILKFCYTSYVLFNESVTFWLLDYCAYTKHSWNDLIVLKTADM